MAYFVPNFLLIIFLKSILVYQVPPTQKIGLVIQMIQLVVQINQKNGDISGSSGQNFYRFFLSDSTSKNTSNKSN